MTRVKDYWIRVRQIAPACAATYICTLRVSLVADNKIDRAMKRTIGELRERGVFRATGLYVAATWLVLQISDVVFPAFDIADSFLRYILFGAIAGLPAVLVFSWFYDVSAEGIRTEDEVREAGEKRSSGVLSRATIVLLVLALGVSLYANYEQAGDVPEATPKLMSILVSDFVNDTGEPIFDGSLEPALAIGIEGAPFISAFARHDAARIAEKISGSESLDEEAARLVSVHEGIQLVLVGSIKPDGDGYEFSLRAIDPREGEIVVDAWASADNKIEVLPAVGQLAIQIREGLGDATLEDDPEANETFTAASLEAARYYTIAQSYNHRGQNLEAIEYYEKAIGEDPEFGRAYSGWALSTLKLGRMDETKALWEKTLALLDGMTERERYRTLGAYYLMVTGNYFKAIENYELLVEKFPADDVGRNNLAVAYLATRQVDEAFEQAADLVRLHPGRPAYRANYALFAMYAAHFEVARTEAESLLAELPDYYLAYIALAIAELAEGKHEAAVEVYGRMGEQGLRASSLAITGLADIALLRGEWLPAVELLSAGITADLESGNSHAAAHKNVYLAYARMELGQTEAALDALDAALKNTQDVSHLLPAARLLVVMGEVERAAAIRDSLDTRLQQTSHAAADIISAELALADADAVAAVDALNYSLAHSDTWLARCLLGRAYANAGYHAEALGELEQCEARLGESTALFLDDIPTFHYSAPLYYWLGLTRQQLGMLEAARNNYTRYLSLRVDSDQSEMSRDARERLAELSQ